MRLLFLVCCATALMGAERINHEGRVLGPQATVTTAVQFNTAQADAIMATMQIMPTDSAWNEDIRTRPLLGNSAAMITKIRNDVYDAPNNYSNRRRLVVFQEMNYVLVPNNQPLVGIRFVTYPDDSDFNGGTNPIATWPVPSIMPIETWPTGTGAQTLEQWQRAGGGDRHSIVVQPGTQRFFETWEAQLTNNTPNWQASNGAIFSLNSNATRPSGWTSGDAAGLPMLPALVRYDECQRGVVEHALRIVVKRSRKSFIYPASHQAGSTTDVDTPAMGQRLRLKSSFVIPASWSAQERAVAVALKKYGALVADNGSFFSISICPDNRWPSGCWNHFSTGSATDILDINQFDVVQTTGENDGPRADGKPGADAGSDQNVILAAGAALSGVVTGGASALWSVYPADGPQATRVHFANAHSAITTVTFDAAGSYVLLLAANKLGFTPAYDAVIVTVTASGDSNPAPTLTSISPSSVTAGSGSFTLTIAGNNFLPSSTITWDGQATLLPLTATLNQMTVVIPLSYVSAAGTPLVGVVNPIPGGGASTAQTMVITAASGGGSTSAGGSNGGGGGGCGIGGVAAVMGMLFAFYCLRL